nr:surface lipoprotein assembly modifier [uncultured Rhodoferax sp.]
MSNYRDMLVAISLFWLTFVAMAQEDAPSLVSARQWLLRGLPAQALAELEPGLMRYAGTPDYDYLLGLAWQGSGDTGQALFAFERVVMADASHVEARLKAASILLERGDERHAAELLQPLATLPLTSDQQQVLERLRRDVAQAEGGRGLSLSGYLALGVGGSDNVTSGPDSPQLLIPLLGNTPTALGTAARDQDQMATVEAGLTLRKELDASTWVVANGNLSQNFNRSRKDVKEGVVYLDLGLQKRMGKDHWGATLLAQNDLVSDAVYRSSLGARLNWVHPWSEDSRVSGYLQHLRFDFPDHAIDNAARMTVGLSHDGATSRGARHWQYGLYAGKEVSKDDIRPHFSFRLWGVHLGGSVPVNDQLVLSLGLAYEEQRHLATDALYLVVRRDSNRSLGLAADYKLGERWHLIPRYTITRNMSNTALYDYTRNTFSLQLRWDF